MARVSKRFKQFAEKVPTDLLSIEEAIALMKDIYVPVKFDETVDVVIKLGTDPKKGEHSVRGSVSLRNGTGKQIKIGVFAEGEDADKALKAGAFVAGADNLIQKVSEGVVDCDVYIATPAMMPKISKIAKVLGPRGIMPNPKSGTVSADVVAAVSEFVKGKVTFKNDKAGYIAAGVGKFSFEAAKLSGNIEDLIASVRSLRPSTFKGKLIESVRISSTMGPSFGIVLSSLGI